MLDQFSRNIYRDQPESFAYDGLALALSQEAISLQLDAQQPRTALVFVHAIYA